MFLETNTLQFRAYPLGKHRFFTELHVLLLQVSQLSQGISR